MKQGFLSKLDLEIIKATVSICLRNKVSLIALIDMFEF